MIFAVPFATAFEEIFVDWVITLDVVSHVLDACIGFVRVVLVYLLWGACAWKFYLTVGVQLAGIGIDLDGNTLAIIIRCGIQCHQEAVVQGGNVANHVSMYQGAIERYDLLVSSLVR